MEEGLAELFLSRLSLVRAKLDKLVLDALLVSSEPNIRYLTGFWGKDSESLLLLTGSDVILFTDFRFIEEARRCHVLSEVVQWRNPFMEHLRDRLGALPVERLGFEVSIAYSRYVELKDALQVELVPCKGVIEDLRKTKDSWELSKIKRAAEIADSVFDDLMDLIRPGVSELELAAEIEYMMKKRGASGPSFEVVVASGANSSMPHAKATTKRICKGDLLKLDFGCVVDGYCSDLTRTVVVGQPTEEQRKIHRTVLEAQEEALRAVRRGATGSEVDDAARRIIDSSDYSGLFGHGLGHGVGLEVHELPHLHPASGDVIEDGMVFTIEPGVYIPGLGGVRIEDLVAVRDGNVELISRSPKELLVI